MKKPLQQISRTTNLYYRQGYKIISGLHPKIKDYTQKPYGDWPDIRGDCTHVRGDCTWLRGDCTGIKGDLDLIPMEQRKEHPNISYWVEDDD